MIKLFGCRIWNTTLKEFESRLLSGDYPPVFAKPATRAKRFTGCVFDSEYDLSQVYGVSRQEQLFCSEVVTWLSEYRVYVVNSEIRSIDRYVGDATIKVDVAEIERAIQVLDKAGESYGDGIDFRVLDNGMTALIEMNEGFALGAYSIDRKNYTDLIIKRWEEILSSPNMI